MKKYLIILGVIVLMVLSFKVGFLLAQLVFSLFAYLFGGIMIVIILAILYFVFVHKTSV